MESLRLQEHPSPLLLCTATPSPYLENMAREYGATYCVNPHAPGIGSDWNFAMEQAKAAGYDLVTPVSYTHLVSGMDYPVPAAGGKLPSPKGPLLPGA